MEFASAKKPATKSSTLMISPTSSHQLDNAFNNDDSTRRSQSEYSQISTINLDDADESDLVVIKKENFEFSSKSLNTQGIIEVSCI